MVPIKAQKRVQSKCDFRKEKEASEEKRRRKNKTVPFQFILYQGDEVTFGCCPDRPCVP